MKWKWLCKFRHYYVYYDSGQYLSSSGRYDNDVSNSGQLVLVKRRCKRCQLTEVQSLVTGNWYEVLPTKDEIRDIKIDELLK